MKCQRENCQEQATFHVTDVRDDAITELHLCQKHYEYPLAEDVQKKILETQAVPGLDSRLTTETMWPLVDWAVRFMSSLTVEEAVPQLILLLKHEHPGVRWAAVAGLGRFGRGSPATIAALRKALADGDGEVREAAAWALGQVERAPLGEV